MHKWAGEIERDYDDWLENGPQEPYIYESPHAVTCHNKLLPIWIIPFSYRNTPLSRRLVLWGLLPEPWPNYIDRLHAARIAWANLKNQIRSDDIRKNTAQDFIENGKM